MPYKNYNVVELNTVRLHVPGGPGGRMFAYCKRPDNGELSEDWIEAHKEELFEVIYQEVLLSGDRDEHNLLDATRAYFTSHGEHLVRLLREHPLLSLAEQSLIVKTPSKSRILIPNIEVDEAREGRLSHYTSIEDFLRSGCALFINNVTQGIAANPLPAPDTKTASERFVDWERKHGKAASLSSLRQHYKFEFHPEYIEGRSPDEVLRKVDPTLPLYEDIASRDDDS